MALTTDRRMDSRSPKPLAPPIDLAIRLEGSIERRARGQIRDLHVDCSLDRIIVRGRARTQHAKQLALEAVLDLLPDDRTMLTNQIVVS